ncbi:MAG TPA: glutathione S-transferase N-terminal domain-containing protein, partial [Gammaproteobacteria bacterium]|nr:glutathione S-transferase N-terminal domain-containing protein [Gammaproteobacteria bacterium]
MIDLYYWPTGNGKKITIMLEECGLPYRVIPVNIGKGDQFRPDFLRLSPNNKMPAIVDHEAAGGPLSIFESGAILEYLADKTGRFLPREPRGRFEVLQWLYWQVGGLGPMAGQAHHFLRYAPQRIEYARERFRNETARLYLVMNARLADREFLAGDYSIADMAAWPWIFRHDWQEQDLNDFPHLQRWFGTIAARPAVIRGTAVGSEWMDFSKDMSDADKQRLFGLRGEDLHGKP